MNILKELKQLRNHLTSYKVDELKFSINLSFMLSFLFVFIISSEDASCQKLPPSKIVIDKVDSTKFKDEKSPLVSEYSEPGGKIILNGSQYPKSINCLLEYSNTSIKFFRMMYNTLGKTDPISLDTKPLIAERWEISENNKEFTFYIDKEAKWSDGKPITSEDVVWSFNAIKNPENLTGVYQATMSRLVKAEAIDSHIVKIYCDSVHWNNFLTCAGLFVLPKHWWEKQNFNKVNFEFPIVSGPYKIKELKEQYYLRFIKRKDYWRINKTANSGLNNFDEVEFKFFSDQNIAFEAFKKRQIDFFSVYKAQRWVTETLSGDFEKGRIVKQAVYNSHPLGYQGFAFNMRRKPFDDKNVRLALAHLLNRNRMNSTLMYNQYKLLDSYFPDLWDSKHKCPNKLIEFDVEKARILLKESGWVVNAKTGKLEKDGDPLIINFLTRSPSSN